MDWKDNLAVKCQQYQMELIIDGEQKQAVIICPKKPTAKIEHDIIQDLPPGIKFDFVEAPRVSTLQGLGVLFGSFGIHLNPKIETKDSVFEATTTHPAVKENRFLKLVQMLLNKDPYFTSWKLVINGQVVLDNTSESIVDEEIEAAMNDSSNEFGGDIIPVDKKAAPDKDAVQIMAKQTRPERVRIFSDDDMLNLRITLEACKSVDEFINSI